MTSNDHFALFLGSKLCGFFSCEEKRAVTMRIVILIVALAILLQLTAVTQALKQEGKFQLRFASISKV